MRGCNTMGQGINLADWANINILPGSKTQQVVGDTLSKFGFDFSRDKSGAPAINPYLIYGGLAVGALVLIMAIKK